MDKISLEVCDVCKMSGTNYMVHDVEGEKLCIGCLTELYLKFKKELEE